MIVDRRSDKDMAKDINKDKFDEATKLKLQIFGDSFIEWLPVFLHDRYTTAVHIFDFFAGSGTDPDGNLGSPLILLNKAKGENKHYCSNAKTKITFLFNEGMVRKSNQLQENTYRFIEQCKRENNCETCVYQHQILNDNFQELFNDISLRHIFQDKKIAKFVLLDQYGFKQINDDIFKQLISFPKTDFIFFISSSFVRRFKEHPHTKKYIDTTKINFEDENPNKIHRTIANYFRSLIPEKQEYYLHHFSIKKGSNYYGLIFGSNHTLGMEKFLKVCWKYDTFSGEANYNIDNNHEEGTLFFQEDHSVKKDELTKEIREKILSGEITNNKIGLKYTLNKGCLPQVFTNVVKELEKKGLIKRTGTLNYRSTNIHKVPQYFITRLSNDK